MLSHRMGSRSHTWAAEGEQLVETTEERVLYLGACLTAEHADRFAKANAYHDWRNARVRWPIFFAHHDARRAHAARSEKSPTPHRPARKGGFEHQRVVPRWNRNHAVEVTSENAHGSVHPTTSENVQQRHLSGRAGPVLNLLDDARQDWAMGASPRSLRGKLLEIFRLLDIDEGT